MRYSTIMKTKCYEYVKYSSQITGLRIEQFLLNNVAVTDKHEKYRAGTFH